MITTGAASDAPFSDAHKIKSDDRIELWRIESAGAEPPIVVDPGEPTSCEIELPPG